VYIVSGNGIAAVSSNSNSVIYTSEQFFGGVKSLAIDPCNHMIFVVDGVDGLHTLNSQLNQLGLAQNVPIEVSKVAYDYIYHRLYCVGPDLDMQVMDYCSGSWYQVFLMDSANTGVRNVFIDLRRHVVYVTENDNALVAATVLDGTQTPPSVINTIENFEGIALGNFPIAAMSCLPGCGAQMCIPPTP